MARLSHNLGLLKVAGIKIVDTQTGQPVLLRGVNRSGLEYSEPDDAGFLSAAGITGYEIRYIAQQWGANIIRLPVNQDWALRGRKGYSGENYLSEIDRVVSWAAQCGAYTLIDLQWLDADNPFGPNRQFVAPLPNQYTLEFWNMLAQRYRDEPAVLFDLFNEPHDRAADDPYPLWHPDGTQYPDWYRTVGMNEWQPWARQMIETIRAVRPDGPIWVSGVDWGYNLTGFPLEKLNLVYSTHVYRNKGDDWDNAFGRLAFAAPVFAGEWGGEPGDVNWGRKLRKYMEERGMGWTAWSWADKPKLVERYAVSDFGRVVSGQES
jgi:aryl-phospho-beta-D-glucosidase BglC (GH1 family)